MASARHRGSAPPQAPSPHRNRALLLLAALACLAGHAAAQQPAAPGDWTVVTDMRARLEGVEVSIVGAPQQAFARAAPRTLDPHLLSDFAAQLGVLQEVSGEGNNMFTDTAEQVGRSQTVWRGDSVAAATASTAALPCPASPHASPPPSHPCCAVRGHGARRLRGGRGRAGV